MSSTETEENSQSETENSEDSRGFKVKLQEIDEILEQLQKGDLELENSLELYENAIGLLRECKEILNESEEKIEILRKEGEEIVTEDFDPEDTEHE